MKINTALLALIAMTILGACQINGQGASPVAAQADKLEGPGDSGGGDTCNGKMIESYKVDISEMDEFKEYIQPILKKTAGKPDENGKGGESPLLFSPKMKNWYLIDCKLQDIPKERKGLYLETYQTAIHTSREVFIDSVSYGKMAKEEKAKLLLHEMVMSYYLTKYLTLEDMCKVAGSCSPQQDISVVSKWKMFRPEPYRPLNEEDHQKIRYVTAWLWERGAALTEKDFLQTLKNNDFDKRFAYTSDSTESAEIQVDPQVLVRMFKKYQWSKSYPKFCQFDAEMNVSQSSCQTEVTADIRDYVYSGYTLKQLYIKIRITRESDKRVLEQEFSYPLVNAEAKITLHEGRFGSVLKAAPLMIFTQWPGQSGVVAKEGLRSQALFMMLNFADRGNPEIFQLLYQTYVWYSFGQEIIEKDGKKYKQSFGYNSLLPEDSETLFIENELPFNFKLDLTSSKQTFDAVLVAP